MNYEQLAQRATYCHAQATEMLKDNSGERGIGQKAHQLLNEARGCYNQILNDYPDHSPTIFMLGSLCMQVGESGLAIAMFERYLSLNKDTDEKENLFSVYNNLGATYRQEHKNDLAEEAYRKCLELDEKNPDILANMCALYVNEGYPEKGIPWGEKCLEVDPNHPQGLWNLGLLYLENGETEKGFKLYNKGFETKDRILRQYTDRRGLDAPLWWGEEAQDKTIVLWGEQGIGDEILFAQYIHEAKKLFKRIILDCHPRLLNVFQRSFPGLAIYPTRKEKPVWSRSEIFDLKQSISSLPEFVKGSTNYLKPNEFRARQLRERIRFAGKVTNQSGPIIGISWTGGKKKTRVDKRTVPLDLWKPLFDLPVTLVGLQYGDMQFELQKYPERVINFAGVTEAFDYDHNIALAKACDAVISVNTSIVHACGAMGQKCLTLTPHAHAWRYGKKDKIMPYYKSVEQIHLGEDEEWEAVMPKAVEWVKCQLLT